MLEDIVQYDIIQRQNVLHLDVAKSVLGRGEVAEGVRDEDTSVVTLHAVQQPLDTQTDRAFDRRLIHSVV